jgi:hypothetical protein
MGPGELLPSRTVPSAVGSQPTAILKTMGSRGRRVAAAVPNTLNGGAMMNARLRHNGKLTQRYYALETAHSVEGAKAEGAHRTRAQPHER